MFDTNSLYGPLKTKVLPKFQELGNAIVFARMIEQALNLEEISDLLIAAPFQQYIPPPAVNHVKGETLEQKVQQLKNKYGAFATFQLLSFYVSCHCPF